tara:strand:+ start:25268 stop:25450 length:183 start_codon:yes stop_codon:yes gene_type:complete
MAHKITINKNTCIGCGNCSAICPKSFKMNGDKAVVKSQPKEITCEKDAEAACPVQAISIS